MIQNRVLVHKGFTKLGAQRPDICQLVKKKGFFCTTDFVWFVLTAQKELEALLWICFTPVYEFLIFLRKNMYLDFFHRKNFDRKKISHILGSHLGSHLYRDFQVNGHEKNVRFFSIEKKNR